MSLMLEISDGEEFDWLYAQMWEGPEGGRTAWRDVRSDSEFPLRQALVTRRTRSHRERDGCLGNKAPNKWCRRS